MKSCRHRWKLDKRVAEDLFEAGPAPSRQRFRVMEVFVCASCDGAGTRWSRHYGPTARAALKRAGVPEHELPPPPGYKPKAEPTTAPLTSWPFPVSTHYPKESPR